jgi:hypothetical protein
MFFKDRETFYLTYLAINRPPKEPQTQAMAVGSSFDAHVKARLSAMYLGKSETKVFDELFESQVEDQNKAIALTDGHYAWDAYIYTGAFADLCELLKQKQAEPHMEADVYKTVEHHGYEIPFRGKPDLFFTLRSGRFLILDWKVNGFYSKWPKSPDKGYIMIRGGKNTGSSHKDAVLQRVDGVICNIASGIELINPQWALQLSTYAWLVGCPVGASFIACIDQLACDNKKTPGSPEIRVAEHRSLITKRFQENSFDRYITCFQTCQSDHFFPEMSKEDSAARCLILDDMYKNFDPNDPAYIELTEDLWKKQQAW